MKLVEKAGPVLRSKSVHAYPLRLVILVSAFVLALLLPGTAAAQTGGVSGTVTDAVTGAGLSVFVQVYSWNGAGVAGITSTAGTGAWVVTGLPAGFYYARTFGPTTYLDEAYNNVLCEPSCPVTASTPITVNAGATTLNINFALTPASVSPATGIVTGSVTDAVTAAPIASVSVQIYQQLSPTSFQFMGSGVSDGTGAYSIAGLPAGTYVAVAFVSSTSSYISEGYNNVPCAFGSCSITSFTPFTVNAGATTPNINFPLSPGGSITGTVTDATTAAPLQSVSVQIYSSSAGFFVTGAVSNAAGVYTVTGLPAGTYFARTFVSSNLNYVDEAYNDISCFPSCTMTSTTPITVTGTATTANINFPLSPGGGIAGTVTDGGTGNPLASVTVQVYNSTGSFVKSASTNAAGAYSVVGLPPGNYFARTFVSSTTNNLDEAYNNVPCSPTCTITAATPITVSGTATTSGISFVLPNGGTIAGTTTDARTGAPGISISVQIFSSTGGFVKSGFTNSAGVYSVTGLAAGTYYARTSLSSTYVSELYNNIDCPHNACLVTTGTPISVVVGFTQGGINFPLVPAGAADVVVDFGAPGLWMLSSDGSASQIHSLSPVATATGDFDGNGRDDLVVNFGPGIGVWVWMNHATWVFIHSVSPPQMVIGDLDDNGRDELIAVFAGAGIWRWSDGNWFQVHGVTPNRLAVGRIDTVAGDDLIVDFPSVGIWILANNSTWSQLHPLNSVDIVTADLNGNFRDEIVVSFAGQGVWVYRQTTWTQLHTLIPARIAVGHLDTSTREDLVIDFGAGHGVYTLPQRHHVGTAARVDHPRHCDR